MVEREYEEAGKFFKEKRFFINSIPPIAKTFLITYKTQQL